MVLFDTFNVLEAKISSVRKSTAIDFIDSCIKTNSKIYICLANVYTVILMKWDTEFRQATNAADLVLADGLPIVVLSRLQGQFIPERIAGPDIMTAFADYAEKNGHSFFLLGSTVSTLKKLKANMEKRWPGLIIKGTYSPPTKDKFSLQESTEMIHQINESKADVLWVGLSAPKQEKWIYQYRNQLQPPVCIGVGAAFDFLAGTTLRAPLWMQHCGLEWLFRLISEPRRLWKRYILSIPLFFILAMIDTLKKGFRHEK